MRPESSQPCRLKVGDYACDPEDGSLVREGMRVTLALQPQRLLEALLRAQGHVVSRDALAHALWPHNPQLDIDCGLNAAVRKLRVAFGDVSQPFRYIETLPRRGYRLIAPVSEDVHPTETTVAPDVTTRRPAGTPAPARAPTIAAALGAVVIAALALGGWSPGSGERSADHARSPHSADHLRSSAALEVMSYPSDHPEPAAVLLATALEHALRSDSHAVLASWSADDAQTGCSIVPGVHALPHHFVLEGQVEQAGERVRVTLRLVEPGRRGEACAFILERPASKLAADYDRVARTVL